MVEVAALELAPSKAAYSEWLVANGLGGYSSSTTIGMNTRKYHGLLVAPLSGANRHVMLAKMEEAATVGGEEFELSTNSYPGKIHPEGFRRQNGFSFSAHPVFSYSLGNAKLEKSVRMVHGRNTVVVSYRLKSGKSAELSLRPLLSLRPIHSDPQAEDKEIPFSHDYRGFEASQPAPMRMSCSTGKFRAEPLNFRNMIYPVEGERGHANRETLFSPGRFDAKLSSGEELHICATMDNLSPSEALDLLERQSLRVTHLRKLYAEKSGFPSTDFSDMLLLAADSFVISSRRGRGIIAGYHWFSEWGRDAMISLPGLLLSTGRYPLARELLASNAALIKDGLLPNFIAEDGVPQYTSSDASMWFLNSVREFAERTGELAFVRGSLWKCMRSTVSSCIRGNAVVQMDDDCLLRTLIPASTWMDAQSDGPVTPRVGKPIELNALWYSNLHFMLELSRTFGDNRTASIISPLLPEIESSFQKFLSADGGLFDLIGPADQSVRPNQIFAVSLPRSPLNAIQQRHVFNLVRSRLYTPLGLHTLSPQDPRYRDTYFGNQRERDLSYHQGIIWPWLLGAFYDAQLRVYPGTEKQVLASLKPLAEKMSQGCVATLPELYEPKSGRPAGAVSQAWSVAEVLRIYTKVKSAGNVAGGSQDGSKSPAWQFPGAQSRN